jgi:hypothetical protein
MRERQYLILLDIDARKRHWHRVESGKIEHFVVQLEIRYLGVWKAVIRYDCAHGYAHKDCYNINEARRKIKLFLGYENALTFADDDINENWERYKEMFLKGEFPC